MMETSYRFKIQLLMLIVVVVGVIIKIIFISSIIIIMNVISVEPGIMNIKTMVIGDC